ncbi:MAG: YdcF family protein [Chloroflexota bacterium]
MMLTPELIAQITAYLDATTLIPDHADLIFVFGTRLLTPAQLALDLYHQQPTSPIVLTGGNNRHTGQNEADSHYAFLTTMGVPTDTLILENRSTNTFENVTFAIPLIEQELQLPFVKSVLAICKWMHSRRALMTLKRHFPPGIRFYACTYEPEGVTRENWFLESSNEISNVLKNWERIPQYIGWGHIQEIVRDGDSYL